MLDKVIDRPHPKDAGAKPAEKTRGIPRPKFRQTHERAQDFFRSVDSAPQAVAVKRARIISDGFLVSFAALSVLALTALVLLAPHHPFGASGDVVIFTADRTATALPVRIFFGVFFLNYALYAFGSLWSKLKLLTVFMVKLGAVCLIIDGCAYGAWTLANVVWPLELQQLLIGLAGIAIFPHTLLSNARLPADSGTPITRRAKLYEYALVGIAASLAGLCAVIMATTFAGESAYLRSIALLGGMGPGVFLAQQVFIMQLGIWGWGRNQLSRRKAFAPPVSVLIPAHNEAHQIRETLKAIDRAAAHYEGSVHVVVAENCSSDDTAALAERVLSQCTNIAGYSIEASDIPGKAKALNRGIARITDDFVVRIDADTMIAPDALRIAMRHFAHDNVGAVGGLPLPQEGHGLMSKVRAIEVLLRHGFVQVAFGAFGGIFGLPGMFVIYRKSALIEAGGIVEGMNGEDTDITLRISNIGYRLVSDPKAKFYTETPDTLAFLREQRTRWFRSLYHVTAHNRHTLFAHGSIVGCLVLPFTLLNGARRAMMAPLLIFGALVYLAFGSVYDHPSFATVVAIILGMPFVMAVFVIALWRRFDLMIYIPLYMGFRFLRSYYTLGSVLSLIYPQAHERLFYAPTPMREQTSRENASLDSHS
ncbi:glycosyltransferase [Woodsholea maritima]|uniref:glycosyltransferase n=1 Tax=Woodsholea maritima TaxID=240237 RepID=UPI0003764984|nr:glycosyltransferase [Woodsholea maritima]